MESRKLGNKTKIIKLMSNVAKYGSIIPTPPLKHEFMSKYQKNIGPRNKSYSPFTYRLSIQPRKEAKTQWENPPLNMDMKNKILEILSSIMLHSMISDPQ